MQSRVMNHPSADISNSLLHSAVIATSTLATSDDLAQPVPEVTRFSSRFVDGMEMYADPQTVAAYFDQHHEWFRRCAHPMTVDAIGQNSYALIIGQFGSFGYQVEPKIGLDLLPQDSGVYRIETVPVPNYTPSGYDVDFRASMELVELSGPKLAQLLAPNSQFQVATRVQWQLDLTVDIQFPRFIHALPQTMIQSTGDSVIRQVVRQVSHRLTRKVQADFHQSHGITLPQRSRRWPFRKDAEASHPTDFNVSD